MDIHFKQEEKTRASGKAELQAGSLLRYFANMDVLKVSKARAYTLFFHNNNAAEEAISVTDFMRMQVSLQEMAAQLGAQGGSQGNIAESLFPPEFQLGEDVVNSNDAFLSGNWSLQFSDKAKLRFSLLGVRLQRERAFVLDRQIFITEQHWSGEEVSSQLSYISSAQLRWDYKPGEKWTWSLRGDLQGRVFDRETLRAFSDTSYAGDISHGQHVLKGAFAFGLISRYQRKEGISYKFKLDFDRKLRRRRDLFQPEDSLFFSPLMLIPPGFFYEQYLPFVQRHGAFSVKRNAHVGHWRWSVGALSDLLDERLMADVFIPQGDVTSRRLTFGVRPEFVLRYEYAHWDLQMKLKGGYKFIRDEKGGEESGFSFFAPSMEMLCSYLIKPGDRNNRLNFSWRYSRDVASYEESNGYLLMGDTRSLLRANLSLGQTPRDVHRFGLFYMHMKLPYRFLIFSLGYTHKAPDFVEQYEFYDQYWMLSYSPYSLAEQVVSLNLNYRDKLPVGISQNTTLYLSSNYFGLFSAAGVYGRGNALQAGLKVNLNRYFLGKKVKWSVFYSLNSILSSSFSLYSKGNVQHQTGFDLTFSIGTKWRLDLTATHSFRNVSSFRGALTDVNLDMEYALKKGWHFIFHGRGINRLNSRTFFYVEQTENYLDYKSYQTYPGYVGLGVRKDF